MTTDGALVGVRISRTRDRAALTIRHPKGNIVTAAMVASLQAALESMAGNPHLKLITIEGDGADFSFGASVPEHAPDRIGEVLPAMHRLVERLLEAPAVTAAVVKGRCLGGGFEIALACDLIFASDSAQFGLPEVALGVFPPAAAALLPARVGVARATRAIVTGESRSAAEWRAAGLVEIVAPAKNLEDEVERWFAVHLQPRSAAALRHAVAAARLGLLAHVRATLPALERLYLNELMQTSDAVEGIAAFIEKRPARWTDG
jgi:cyclohexa-1,5-dienecarbonyl-CoA hydratase